jgi:hypothetical protein
VDLLDKIKISEMVPFVVKFRMFLGKVLYDSAGVLLDHLAPVTYRVEFDAASLEEGEEDFKADLSPEAIAASRNKLQESGQASGLLIPQCDSSLIVD